MTATGNNALTVTVWKYPESTLDTGATVSATVTKPDESTEGINFASQGDGNYTYTYTFDANGTWKFDVTATHSGYTEGTTESYVYVGDFNLLISFVNNGQDVYDRHTGSVRNLVTNEDGNYFTGITGNTTIYYPNSTAWVSSQSMTESGSGEYYYNFTAPTTLGDYTATSSFTCGANTDSNSQGRFTVVTSCGNGTCDSWESCSTCPSDCGSCEEDVSAGAPVTFVGPAKGVFVISIVRVDKPVEVGEKFDFTYIVKNETRSGNSAYIEHWLEKDGEKVVSGSETIYLLAGEEREVSESLLLLDEMAGKYQFFIVLTRAGQDQATDYTETRIMLGAPTTIELDITSLEPGKETEPLEFSIYIGSNKDETLPIVIEERLYMGEVLIWEKNQTVAVTAFERLFEEVYGLEAGKYRLKVTATYGTQTTTVVKEFERKPKIEFALPLPPKAKQLLLPLVDLFPWLILLLLLLALLLLRKLLNEKLFDDRKKRNRLKVVLATIAITAVVIICLLFLYMQAKGML